MVGEEGETGHKSLQLTESFAIAAAAAAAAAAAGPDRSDSPRKPTPGTKCKKSADKGTRGDLVASLYCASQSPLATVFEFVEEIPAIIPTLF